MKTPSASIVSSALAAHIRAGAEDSLENISLFNSRIDTAVGVFWGELLGVIKKSKQLGAKESQRQARVVLQRITGPTKEIAESAFNHAVKWGYDQTFQIMVRVLPAPYWQAAFPGIPGALLEARRVPPEISAERYKAALYAYKPPNKKDAERIIRSGFRGRTWETRLKRWTDQLEKTRGIPQIIANGFARGDSIEKTAKKIKPFVHAYQSAARRLVRTEYARIENRSREEVYTQFGKIIDGYQILAVRDERTRPTHAARSGTIFWKPSTHKSPSSNSKPELPDAPNCRCRYAPVVGTKSGKGVLNVGPKIDPVLYGKWFDQQPEKLQRKIVGRERWDANLDRLPGKTSPRWVDFINSKTGELLSTEEIEDEGPREFAARRKRINKALQKRKKEIDKAFSVSTGREAPEIPFGGPANRKAFKGRDPLDKETKAKLFKAADSKSYGKLTHEEIVLWKGVLENAKSPEEIRKIQRGFAKAQKLSYRKGVNADPASIIKFGK